MRNPAVDLLKAIASQVIVLHHLMLYSPMADVLGGSWLGITGFLLEQGRYVVQVFLVVGGFLATQSLVKWAARQKHAPQVTPLWRQLGQLVWQRYLRLAKPYWVAIAVAVFLVAVATRIADFPGQPHNPGFYQLLAHVFFVHELFGYEALSAGFWYVSIDFQLYALMMGLVWMAHGLSRISRWSVHNCLLLFVVLFTALSLLWLNCKPYWDEWGFYFFGSYGLGVLAYWVVQQKNGILAFVTFNAMMGLVALALAVQWRDRIVLAGLTAMVLVISERFGPELRKLNVQNLPGMQWIKKLGDISYSVFLIHYPICMVISALVLRVSNAGFAFNLMAFVLTWVACVFGGHSLYRLVESRG